MMKDIGWNIINGIFLAFYNDSGFRKMFSYDSDGASLSLAVFGALAGAVVFAAAGLLVAVHRREPTRSIVRRLSGPGFFGGAALYALTYCNAGDGFFLAFMLVYAIAIACIIAYSRKKSGEYWSGKTMFICIYFVIAMIAIGFLGGISAQSWLTMISLEKTRMI
ncbi:MAG: hypothetical protein IJQ34_00075 [Kiritimatiellae bacterium]|nr:hypothetical protein [Kiritimatiellia bacterium]